MGYNPNAGIEILKLLGQSIASAGQAFMNPNQAEASPSMSQGNSMQDLGNNLMASGDTSGMMSLEETLSKQLGGYYEGAQKALKEGGYQHTTEALQAGVPPTHVLQTLAKMLPPSGAFDQGGVVQDPQGQITGIRQPGWVSRIGQAGLQAQGIPSQDLATQQLQQLLGTQEVGLKGSEMQKNQALANFGIQARDRNTGAPTTPDDPNSTVFMAMPNGQIVQLGDKMADYQSTANEIDKQRQALEKDREDLIKMRGTGLFANFHPMLDGKINDINEKIKSIDVKKQTITSSMESRLKNKGKEKTEFDSEDEARKANLPKGTIITIGGRRARVK